MKISKGTEVKIDILGIIAFPVGIIALIKTWGTPL